MAEKYRTLKSNNVEPQQQKLIVEIASQIICTGEDLVVKILSEAV